MREVPGAMRLFVPVVVLAAVAAGCGDGGSGSNDGDSGGQETVAGVSVNNHGTVDVAAETSVDMVADNFYFDGTVLIGRPGEKVTIRLKNESGAEHNFSIDEQKLDKDVEAKQSITLDVTFPPSGTLSFYCSYHKSQGMAGGLQVGGSSSGSSSPVPPPSGDDLPGY